MATRFRNYRGGIVLPITPPTGGGGGGTATPSTIFSGVSTMLWATAADASTSSMVANSSNTAVSEGSTVFKILDKSGGNHHFQEGGSSSTDPIYSATSFAGGHGITFDGVDDYMQVSLGLSSPTKFALFMSMIPISDQANDRYASVFGDFGNPDYGSAQNIALLYENNGLPAEVTLTTYYNGNGLSAGARTDNTAIRVAVIYDGTNKSIYINNGTPVSSAAALALGTSANVTLGTGWNAGFSNYGKFVMQSVCMVWGQDVTSTHRSQMDAWLSAPTW